MKLSTYDLELITSLFDDLDHQRLSSAKVHEHVLRITDFAVVEAFKAGYETRRYEDIDKQLAALQTPLTSDLRDKGLPAPNAAVEMTPELAWRTQYMIEQRRIRRANAH